LLRVAEKIELSKSTITEFFLAYLYSDTDNIQANLDYLDFVRARKEPHPSAKIEAKREAPHDRKTALRHLIKFENTESLSLLITGELLKPLD
jgi:hypothetical protein